MRGTAKMGASRIRKVAIVIGTVLVLAFFFTVPVQTVGSGSGPVGVPTCYAKQHV
jgi:hypothetical protein